MNSKLADRPAAVGIVVADICLMFLWAVLFLSLTTNRVIVENRRAPYGYAVSLGFISVYFLGRELYTLYIFRKLSKNLTHPPTYPPIQLPNHPPTKARVRASRSTQTTPRFSCVSSGNS